MRLEYPITTNLMTLIVLVNHLFQRECFRQCALKLTHFRVLASITRYRGVQSIHSISKDLRLSDSTISLTVNQMERNGLVAREEEKNDRRIVLVRATKQGIAAMEDAEKALARLVSDLWRPLSASHKRTLMGGTAKIDVAQNTSSEMTRQIRAITAYINVYLFTLDAFRATVKENGLLINEFRVLFELNEHHRGISPGKLGCLLFLKPNEITKATDSLVDRHLVNRSRAPLDRRTLLMEITSDGYSLLRKTAPLVDKAFLSGVADTDAYESAQYLEIADIIVGKWNSSPLNA
jgi:DNA-binding MarR family transcriptional regulator